MKNRQFFSLRSWLKTALGGGEHKINYAFKSSNLGIFDILSWVIGIRESINIKMATFNYYIPGSEA